MHTGRIFLSDFKERSRRFSFWAMVAIALFVAVMCVPRPGKNFQVFVVAPQVFMQATNPTWIPMGAAYVIGLFLPIFGYSFVKNAVALDRDTGVMPLLLSRRFPRLQYAFGKFLSNFALLMSLLFAVMLGSWVMTLIHFPGWHVGLWALASPFLVIIPGLAFVSALALLSELLPILRGKGGSIIITIVVFVLIVMSLDDTLLNGPMRFIDITGYSWLENVVNNAAVAAGAPPMHNSVTVLGGGEWIKSSGDIELVFSGVVYQRELLLNTCVFVIISLVLVCLSALLIEKRPLKTGEKKHQKADEQVLPAFVENTWQPTTVGRFSFVHIIITEIQRLSAGLHWFWLLPAAGLWVAGWLVKPEIGQNIMFPLTLGWAMLPLSMLGCEEKQTGVHQWMRTISGAPMRQALASSVTALLFTVLLAFPFICRSAHIGTACTILAFAVLFPILAQVLGSITKTPRAFQILCIVVLYIYLNIPILFLPIATAAMLRNIIIYLTIAAAAFAILLLEQKKAQR